jgi:putative phage-type endonuclease
MNARTTPESQALAVIEPGHDRSKFLGGSDIAAVLGISPWKTSLQLWKDKITPRVEDQTPSAKPQFRRGIRWESVVAEMLVEALQHQGHDVEIVAANKRYQDAEHPFMASEIDFELRLDGEQEITNAELKTVHPFKMRDWGDSGGEDCPIHHTAQVMHGLGITRRKRGILAALFGADELRTYPIDADEETIAAMRARAVSFWTDHVLAGIPPAPVNLEDLSKLFDKDGAGAPLLADPDLAEWIMRARAINAEIKAREAEAEDLEFRIKRAMRDCTEIVMPNGKKAVEWKQRSGSWLDETALKEAHPKLAREFTRKWEKRTFTLKSFDTKGL